MLITQNSPCYQCVFGEKHGETCDTRGVNPGTLSAVASIACAIAIEYLIRGKEDEGLNRIDSSKRDLSKLKVKKNKECRACNGKLDYLSGSKSRLAARLCGSNKYLISLEKRIDLKEASKHLKGSIIKVTNEAILARDVIVMANGRILVSAGSEREARKKYSRLLGF